MFIDEARIEVRAGKGGDGIISFRRDKFVAKGGPDGGNGGDGGSIWLAVSPRMTTLSDYRRQKLFKAESGQNGGRNNRRGKSGEDLVLYFPQGTVLKISNLKSQISNKIDLINKADKIEIAKGGKGGHGNAWFKSSTNQAPRNRQLGRKGEKFILELELKLLADAGIIGLPNSGKSTLLSRLTHAHPKIADYPFTTLEPNLGVLDFSEFGLGKKSLVLADIPGLVEDAHQGKGLGIRFLKHIERCKVLIHIIDSTSDDVVRDYKTINSELKNYSKKLMKKKQIVVLNKIDAISKKELSKKLIKLKRYSPNPISAVAGRGIRELLIKFLSM